MTNFDLSEKVFNFLKSCGVDTVIVCAGARNAPLVFQLDQQPFKKVFYFEERSAAFYALGLMKASQKPVAIITTSGTAAAELLPATIESFYQGLPLILLTADRPKSFRKSGAPQAIEQVGLYSTYVQKCIDWDSTSKENHVEISLNQPIHLNVCFDEPLLDLKSSAEVSFKISTKEVNPLTSATDLKIKNPLIVVGQIDKHEKALVLKFLVHAQAPVYLESLSQLRGESSIKHLVIESSDALVKNIFKHKWCDGIIRIGGVPTLRFWRDLETEFKDLPVKNFTKHNFSGLSRSSDNFNLHLPTETHFMNENIQKVKSLDDNLQSQKMQLLTEFPQSEPSFVFQLSKQLARKAIYLGNSLPIREWDLFAKAEHCSEQMVYANRGANGIDGQLSTYLGWSSELQESFCLVGDLTALYDLAALGLNSLSTTKKCIIIMNNFGGQIFRKVFNNDNVLNSHKIEFEMWARMWGWDYIKISDPEDFKKLILGKTNQIVELQPQVQQTLQFNQAWEDACSNI